MQPTMVKIIISYCGCDAVAGRDPTYKNWLQQPTEALIGDLA